MFIKSVYPWTRATIQVAVRLFLFFPACNSYFTDLRLKPKMRPFPCQGVITETSVPVIPFTSLKLVGKVTLGPQIHYMCLSESELPMLKFVFDRWQPLKASIIIISLPWSWTPIELSSVQNCIMCYRFSFYSILFYYILFYSILFYSILFYFILV